MARIASPILHEIIREYQVGMEPIEFPNNKIYPAKPKGEGTNMDDHALL
jgi:hypothetical protein